MKKNKSLVDKSLVDKTVKELIDEVYDITVAKTNKGSKAIGFK